MVENQEEKILKDIQVCFSIQDIGIIRNGRINDHKYKIKIKDKDGREIEHVIKCPGEYLTRDILKNIWKLLEYNKFAQSDKLIESIKEEVLIWIALIIARVI